MYQGTRKKFFHGLGKNWLQIVFGGRCGKLPSLQAPVRQEDTRVSLKEGWALRVVRKAYRFSEKQKSYLLSKFRIGQTTGHKLDTEGIAREMRRARGTDGARLIQSTMVGTQN